MTELGSEDDLTVLGTDGTVPDPDVEVKGFSIFGSTNVVTHISTAAGNVVINGALQVSSNIFTVGYSSAAKFYGDGSGLTGVSTTTLKIGDSYGGGIVFWVDAKGQQALIAAPADMGPGIPWGKNTDFTGANLDGVYAGKANTVTISTMQGNGSYAAQVCSDYSVVVNGEYYDDWYLPSIAELQLMYAQKAAVGAFAGTFYWTSNEYAPVTSRAWHVNLTNGSPVNIYGKASADYVRCVRAGPSTSLGNLPNLLVGTQTFTGANTFLMGVTASSFTATGAGVRAAQLRLDSAQNLVISSEASSGLGAGVRVSTNMYIVGFASATKYYGDGSALTGLTGLADHLGNHTATQDLNLAGFDIINASSITVAAGKPGLTVSTHLYVMSGNVGIGTVSPASRLQINLGVNKNIGFNTDTSDGTGNARISSYNDSLTASAPLWLNGSTIAFQTNGSEKMRIDASGNLGVGTQAPLARLDVVSTGTASDIYAQVWRNSGGVPVASMTSQGVLYATMPPGTGDNLGNHTATSQLKMGNYAIHSSSDITAARYQIDGSTVLAVLPGSGSLGVGVNAGKVNRGQYNVFVGYDAGAANTSGQQNTFVGNGAGALHVNGMGNLYMGYIAGGGDTSGNNNTFLGAYAGNNSDGASYNVFVGYTAGNSNSTGEENTFVGTGAGYSTDGGSYNSFFGSQAGDGNSSGERNASLGYRAGNGSAIGSDNVFLGAYAGAGGTNYSSSTVLGARAGYNLSGGAGNIFLGWHAGETTTSGGRNLVIGYGEQASAPTASNELNIGGVLFGKLDSKTIGISTRAPQAALHVVGGGPAFANAFIVDTEQANGGTIVLGNDSDSGDQVRVGVNGYLRSQGGRFAVDTTGAPLTLEIGESEKVRVTPSGAVGVGSSLPLAALDVKSTGTASNVYAQVWRNSSGVEVASMTSQGVLYATMPPGTGDNLGNHTATQNLNLAQYSAVNVASVTMVGKGLQIGTDLTASASGVAISTTGAIVTIGAGHPGSVAPGARGVGAVDLQSYRTNASSVAAGHYSVIAGGYNNRTRDLYSVVAGGYNNTANGESNVVGGGSANVASGGWAATVAGGIENVADRPQSTVGGGYRNYARDYNATVAGGTYNYAILEGAAVGGGDGNYAEGYYAAIPGGMNNQVINGDYGFAVGVGNQVTSNEASAVGGGNNIAAGFAAVTLGGENNVASGNYSFAAGYMSSSTANGAFTWSDPEGGVQNFNSVANRTVFKNIGGFLVTGSTNPVMTGRADRGLLVTGNGLVGISTGTPGAALDVVSTGTASDVYAQIWRNANGVEVASMTADGKLYANISAIVGGGDNLGNHTATQELKMGAYAVNTSSHISARAYQIDGSTVLARLGGVGSMAVGANFSDYSTGDYNLFVGSGAGRINTTGRRNTFLGAMAGYNNTSAQINTFVGHQAGYSNNGGSGWGNVFVGDTAGYSNTSGSENTIMGGYMTGYLNTTGWGNVFLGNYSGQTNSAGTKNTFVGYGSGEFNTTGEGNTALGYSAGDANQTGSYNAILGYEAGYSTESSSNTLLGYRAGYSLQAGDGNVLIGHRAGFNLQTGAGNIVIGNNRNVSAASAANELNIGDVIFGKLDAKTVGISTRNPQAALDVVSTGTLTSQYAQIWRDSDGVIRASMTADGKLYATLPNVSGDNLGNHTATQNLNLAGYDLVGVSTVSASSITARYGLNTLTVSTQLFVSNGKLNVGANSGAGLFNVTVPAVGAYSGYFVGPGSAVGIRHQSTAVELLTNDPTVDLAFGANFTPSVRVMFNGGMVVGSSLTVQSPLGTGTPQVRLAGNVMISSATPANYGGVYVSSHLYVNGKLYGDGSALTGLSGADSLGTHVATKTLDMASFNVVGVSSVNFRSNVFLTSATAGNYGGVYVSTHVYTPADLRAGNIYASGKFYGDGSALTGLAARNYLTLSLPTVANEYIEIGNFDMTSGAHNLYVAVTVSDPSFAVAKQYLVPVSYNMTSGLWRDAVPLINTGAASGNDFALEVRVSNTIAYLRLRRVSGAAAGTALVSIEQLGSTADVFTQTGGAGTSAANNLLPVTAITQLGGNVGIGTLSPGSKLEVAGDVTLSGSMRALSFAGGQGVRDEGAQNISLFTSAATPAPILIKPGDAESARFTPDMKLGIGPDAPAYRLQVSSAAGFSGTIVAVSTGTSPVIRLTGDGSVYANRYYGDGSNLTNVGGTLSGGQTPKLAYWTGPSSIGNANLTQDAGGLTVLNSTFTVQGNAFSVGGSTLTVASGKVGIGVAVPDKTLAVQSPGGAIFKVDSVSGYVSIWSNGTEMVRMKP